MRPNPRVHARRRLRSRQQQLELIAVHTIAAGFVKPREQAADLNAILSIAVRNADNEDRPQREFRLQPGMRLNSRQGARGAFEHARCLHVDEMQNSTLAGKADGALGGSYPAAGRLLRS